MLQILICFTLGSGIGFIIRKRKKVLKIIDKLTSYSVYLLLFALGISVGISKEIVANIGKYAYQSVILALGGILGSVLLSFFLYRLYFRSESHEK